LSDPAWLKAWQRGATGYPIVDAEVVSWTHQASRRMAAPAVGSPGRGGLARRPRTRPHVSSIVSHAIAREVALEAFARIKSTRPERRSDPEPMRRKGRRARTWWAGRPHGYERRPGVLCRM